MIRENRQPIIFKVIFISVLLLGALIALFSFSLFAGADDYNCELGQHKYTIIVTPNADGGHVEYEYVCELCGYTYTKITYDGNHKWGAWITNKEPTCTEPGQQYHVCTAASIPHQEYRSIDALGHDYTVTSTSSPTCTENGSITYTCSRCGLTYSETGEPALGHDFVEEVTTEPTYDKEGVLTFTCSRCGLSYTEAIDKLIEHAHQYIVQTRVEADCETAGLITYVCTICGDITYETIPATGHNYGEWVVSKEATLFVDGQQYKTCANNPEHVIYEAIPQHINLTLNVADAVMAPTNISLLLFLVLTLLADLYVIFWDLRMRSKSDKAQKLKQRYLMLAYGLVVVIVGLPILLKLYFQNITYMNLLQITALSSFATIGLLLRFNSHKKRMSLNGSGPIYEIGNQKGHLVSQNRHPG